MISPKFIIFTGPMFGSKTTRLIAAIDRYQIQKKHVTVFKPKMDVRYDMDRITTHNGGSVPAYVVNSGKDIMRYILMDASKDKGTSASVSLPDVIAVDEAFMIDDISDVLIDLYKKGVTILVSSLDLSATCAAFPEIRDLFPYATTIEKCSAVCTVCGHDAYYTHKKFENNKEIEVGGKNLYEPRCFIHHNYMNKIKG